MRTSKKYSKYCSTGYSNSCFLSSFRRQNSTKEKETWTPSKTFWTTSWRLHSPRRKSRRSRRTNQKQMRSLLKSQLKRKQRWVFTTERCCALIIFWCPLLYFLFCIFKWGRLCAPLSWCSETLDTQQLHIAVIVDAFSGVLAVKLLWFLEDLNCVFLHYSTHVVRYFWIPLLRICSTWAAVISCCSETTQHMYM